ncbi:hypothetical protein FF38_13981 [Lucilia cuprina]|uniref:Uncharacterized protein n=1 Tax=Lucilia cuprina TaxID=7375 RepID=A0A0L0C2T0_LUCCU|nr:hypothetical protein FF38_13981 [Lucilia cuprina]
MKTDKQHNSSNSHFPALINNSLHLWIILRLLNIAPKTSSSSSLHRCMPNRKYQLYVLLANTRLPPSTDTNSLTDQHNNNSNNTLNIKMSFTSVLAFSYLPMYKIHENNVKTTQQQTEKNSFKTKKINVNQKVEIFKRVISNCRELRVVRSKEKETVYSVVLHLQPKRFPKKENDSNQK